MIDSRKNKFYSFLMKTNYIVMNTTGYRVELVSLSS